MLTSTAVAVTPFLASEINPDYAIARVAILPIPYEATTTYRKGCQFGPTAILDASQQLECYDDELGCEVGKRVGITTVDAIADTRSQAVTALEMLRVTQERVGQLLADQKFVIALGGEHSITAGVVAAYRQVYPDQPFTVVQIDAHGDLRHEYEGSIHNHACVMRRIVEMGLPTLPVGIRSLCQEEADLIQLHRIPVQWAREVATQSDWIERAIAAISTQQVFITIDLDGLDPTLLPGVGTPEPGGLNWYAMLQFLRKIFVTHDVLGCDVMELAPTSDSVVSEFTAAKLVYKLVGYQAIAKGWL